MRLLRDHYESLVNECGYDPVDFGFGGYSRSQAELMFAFATDGDALQNLDPDSSIISTGIGMTGEPHLGTLGQILTAVELQEAGFDVQFVLADLEPYHYGADLNATVALAKRYRKFLDRIGFDPDRGTLRRQEAETNVFHTAQLLARYYDPPGGDYWPDAAPTEWEEAVELAYEENDGDGWGDPADAAECHSTVLHLADFLHPLEKMNYDQVVVLLGADEHELSVGAERFLADTPVEGSITGLHTRMLPGVNGYPKMSKSIPDSVISLGKPPESIRRLLCSPEAADGRPSDAAVYEMMCLSSTWSNERLDAVAKRRVEGGEAWASARREYAEQIAEFAEMWADTGT